MNTNSHLLLVILARKNIRELIAACVYSMSVRTPKKKTKLEKEIDTTTQRYNVTDTTGRETLVGGQTQGFQRATKCNYLVDPSASVSTTYHNASISAHVNIVIHLHRSWRLV